MSNKKAYIKTFGCQMNVHDSEKMTGLLTSEGYDMVDDIRAADLIIYNTCSIRDKAEQKFLSDLGRLKDWKDTKPHLKIAAAGCIAQQMGKSLLKRAPHLDYVIGPQNIHSISDMLSGDAKDKDARVATDHNPDATLLELPATRKEGLLKAWVSIMYGCNNFCTYCIVPYTRGRETSRNFDNIINEITGLASDGFKEVTLLGQNVNSYCDSGRDFSALIEKANAIEGIERIRFVTNHPKDLSDDLAEAIGRLDKVCEHVHLPLQSGSDKILESMNRKYSFKDYMQKVELLRKYSPDISLTSDIIVGFPGETQEDFQLTLDAVKLVGYDRLFAFKYSERPGTKALDFEDKIPEAEKIARLKILLELQDEIALKNNLALVGTSVEVLVESGPDGDGKLMGRTRTDKIVYFPSSHINLIGQTIELKSNRGNMHSLIAEMPVKV